MVSVENKLLLVKGFQKYYYIHQAKLLSNCLELTRNINYYVHSSHLAIFTTAVYSINSGMKK